MISVELVQKIEGAGARLAVIEALMKKMGASKTGALKLTLTQSEFAYLRDLLGNQWGEEHEFIRLSSRW